MRDNFKGKSIILGAPKYFKINDFLKRELYHLGFDQVIEVSYDYYKFRYKNIFQHTKSFIAKTFRNRPHYKQYLMFKAIEPQLIASLKDVKKVDYALLIRPDTYSSSFIDVLHTKAEKVIAYQWDGLDRYPATYPLIAKFDSFFTFNPADVSLDGVLPVTNFGPASYSRKELEDKNRLIDIYFSGSYEPKRINTLERMIEQCTILGLNTKFIINSSKARIVKTCALSVTNKQISFEENIRNSYNAKIIVDLVFEGHTGLSFRIFEALAFDKKIITTNKQISKYEFYDTSNIFIWTEDTTADDLRQFIEKPYRIVNDFIKNKYSFENWIKYVLDYGNFTSISLPE
ncbi:hypothetical protein M8998_11695 [Sphingobacterium sp. lm-10]|uniref:hypothetical protein n=1 Tax=Sphingobacterium sp. lm-10 TaxID=2944904 RepID=UPI0020215D5B|nr:hypothetical protein [Sphingobacterium sp. lm-10]MCL7988600.1 hypothetical protein [Sphingobacterium sp. lm-10]